VRSERAAVWLHHIIEACDLFQGWVKEDGGADKAILTRGRTRSAIERQLLIISEATHRLHRADQSLSEELAPNIDWAAIRGFGNFIRHRYDEIDAAMIIAVIDDQLMVLRAACAEALGRLSAI